MCVILAWDNILFRDSTVQHSIWHGIDIVFQYFSPWLPRRTRPVTETSPNLMTWTCMGDHRLRAISTTARLASHRINLRTGGTARAQGTWVPTYLPVYLSTYLRTYLHMCLPASLFSHPMA
jgi:hypothetical protein